MPSLCNYCKHCTSHQPHKSKLYSAGRMYYYCDHPECGRENNVVGYGPAGVGHRPRMRTTPEWCPREANDGNSDYYAADND